MRSKDQLKAAINQYDGTVIVVSHDRDFLSGLTDKVYEFTNKTIKEHIGDINEFLRERKAASFREFELDKPKQEAKKEDSAKDNKQVHELKKELRSIEGKIESLEKKIAEADNKLKDPEQYEKYINDAAFFKNYDSLKKDLAEQMEAWEKLAMEIEE
ncbi:MAG: hypothetical protein LRY27_02730 [Chitinophagales bacterium]|nr:hypothetical protein [Chitinophagales bacterium]